VAQELARGYPAKVRSLVLSCTFARNFISVGDYMSWWLTQGLLRVMGLRRLAATVVKSDGGSAANADDAQRLIDLMASNDTSLMIKACAALTAFDSRSWLGELSIPTLVMAGDQDKAVPIAYSRLLAEQIPDARWKVFENGGHFLISTHTELFTRAVLDFLNEIS
jgi:pimeloyl-ACP methyl ester carboxylesterase